MAFKLNNYLTDYEDTGSFGEPTIEEIIAQIAAAQPLETVAPNLIDEIITPLVMDKNINDSYQQLYKPTGTDEVLGKQLVESAKTVAQPTQAHKTPKEVIKSLVDFGAFASGNAVLVDGTYYQPVYNSTGSGETFEQGPLENVITYKEGENKVGGNVNWYSPSGEFQQLTQQQEVNATKDFMDFALNAGIMFGVPAAIGEAVGLAGATGQAVGQGLLTAGTQLGGGASLEDALTAGIKSGAVPIANLALTQIPQFNALPAPVQASVATAVGNVVANGGQLTPAVLLQSIATGLNVANQSNIGALEGLTNSGRTGDDMGGSYEPTEEPVASLPTGTQVAGPMTLSVGGVPIYAESSGASAIRPPAGYEVMSSSLADNKPAGSYYDASVNAWMTPTNEFARVLDLDQILADIETFKSGVNTIDPNVIKNIVDDSLSNLPSGLTLDDVTRVLSNQNYATPQDIQTAINSINIPQGLTEQNVQTIVSNALANNPSLTTDQVSQIVNNAVANIPSGLTADDVTRIIGGQNFATPEDIQTAINSIDIPKGLSEQDVKSIVSNAFASNPSLTSSQVSEIVNTAISQIPSGLTANDVQSIVGSAMDKLPVAPTTQDIVDIIGNQGLASTTQLTDVQSTLESQLNAQGKALMDSLQQQGLDYQTALNEALASQASQFSDKLTGIQTGFESQLDAQGKQYLEALQASGVDYQTALEEAIAQQNAQIGQVQTSFEEQLKNANSASAANFAKVMASLTAMQEASKPKTYTYELADPSTWGSPVYNKTTGPVTPITPLDFGNKEMLKGTQWEKLLSPTYGQIPAQVQFNQPTNMSYNQLIGILGTGRDTLPSQSLSINDVISGIQNQYGQAPKGSMG